MTTESPKDRAFALLNTALDEWEDKVAALQATLNERDREIAALKTQMDTDSGGSETVTIKSLTPSPEQITDLSQKIQTRTRKQEELKLALEAKDLELNAMADRLASNDADLARLVAQSEQGAEHVDGLKRELQEWQDRYGEAQKHLADREQTVSNLEAVISAKVELMAVQEQELDDLRQRLPSKIASLDEYKTRLQQSQDELDALKAEMFQKEASLHEKIVLATGLQEQLNEVQARLGQSEEALQEAQTLNSRHDAEQGAARKTIGNMESQLATVKGQLAQRNKETGDLQNQLKEHGARADSMQATIARLEDELEEAHARIEISAKKAADLDVKLKEGKGLYQSQEATLAAQKELIANMELDTAKVRRVRADLRSKEAELAETLKLVDSRDKLIASLQLDSDELRKTKRHLREAETEISRIKVLTAPGVETPELIELRQAFNDREKAIGALSLAVRKREKSIAELTQEAETWHQRYQKLQEKFPGLNEADTAVKKPSAKKA